MKKFQLCFRSIPASILQGIFVSLICISFFTSCNQTDQKKPEIITEETTADREVQADSLVTQQQTAIAEPTLEKIYTKTELESVYPGGVTAWSKFLSSAFKYPQKAIDAEVQGTVIVQFVVDTDGNVRDVKALSGPDLLADESVRLIKTSGKWIPAKQDGQSVNAYKKQPIVFRLEKQG